MSQDSGQNFDINSWSIGFAPLRSPTDSIHLKKGDHLNDLQTETS